MRWHSRYLPRRVLWVSLLLASVVLITGCTSDREGQEPPKTADPAPRAYDEEAERRETRRRQLYDVVFVDPQRGWAVGGGGTILATIDGGRTWRRQPVQLQENIYSVALVSPQEGWAVGEHGLLVHTSSGGTTWDPQPRPAATDLYRVRFVTPQVGWIVGEHAVILATRDGGRTWHRQFWGIKLPLRDIACFSPQECVIVGSAGTVLTTADGGATWTRRLTPAGEYDNEVMTDAMIARDGTVWAVGGSGKRNYLLRSNDRGKTWTIASDEPPNSPFRLFFWDARRGVVGSDLIALTMDGGATWLDGATPVTGMLQSLFFIDERRGWAVGGRKSIIHTQDGGKTWVLQYQER